MSVPKVVLSSNWRRYVEPWYLAYAALGVAIAGLAPILLPLAVSTVAGAAEIGIVMAVFSLGGLTSPLWGGLADRYRRHRGLLAGGMLAAASGLFIFPFTDRPGIWLAPVLLQSIGNAGATTMATLLVVEAHAESEWDARISWLQLFFGGGRMSGLVLAAVLSGADVWVGMFTGALLVLLGILPGWRVARIPDGPSLRRAVVPGAAQSGECGALSPPCFLHHVKFETLAGLGSTLRSAFGLLQLAWLATITGSAAVITLYPVLMREVFGVDPGLSSLAFALALGIGLFLYSPAGAWAERFGERRLLQAAQGLRLLAFLAFLVLGVASIGIGPWLAMAAFIVVMVCWTPLSVGGTALSARLAPVGEGEALGIFNATTSLAAVLGAVLGGWAAATWGYNAASLLAVVGVAVGLLLAWDLPEALIGSGGADLGVRGADDAA